MAEILYRNKEYYVKPSETRFGWFAVCDTDGIAKGQDLEHVGDSYAKLEHAKTMTDFWADGGHWSTRPDMEWLSD